MSQMLFNQQGVPNAIQIDYLKNIAQLSQINVITTTSAGATLTPDFTKGGVFRFSTNQTTVTVANPINLPVPYGVGADSKGLEWTLLVENTNGASCTVTWGSAYRVGGATSSVASNKVLAISLYYDGTSHFGVTSGSL